MDAALSALPAALTGERVAFDTPAGRCSVYVAGGGPPMLLVHSVNAAASAAEVAPLHEHYRRTHTVFSPDLPGFGASGRGDRDYTPRLMTDALHAIGDQIRRRCGLAPVHALAVSLGCEYLARAAVEKPRRYASLALVSPTGLGAADSLRGPPGTTRGNALLYAALRGPGWGALLFRGLTRPAVIRHFLRRTFGSPAIDERLATYAVATARQPGAHYAPLRFVAGYLWSADIQDVYAALRMPVWLAHGVRGGFTDYGRADIVTGLPAGSGCAFPTGALPYFEALTEFVAEYDAFRRGAAQKEVPPRGKHGG